MNKIIFLTTTASALTAVSHAATLVSSTFVSGTTPSTVVTTGSTVVDWGYLAGGSTAFGTTGTSNFTALNGANYDATPGIGAVTFAPGTVSSGNSAGVTQPTFTFSGGNSPATGTNINAGAWVSSFASNETNGMTLNFNDLGIGTHTVSVYVGHRLTSGTVPRVFSMDYSLAASDGNVTGNTSSNSVAAGPTVIYSVYQLKVDNAADASADLSLVWNSVSGDSGQGYFAGYTIETVAIPESSSALLGGIGALVLLRRRR